jgi:hypothetical protein
MEGTSLDPQRFYGLARTVADREEERARDREQFETLTRLVAKKGTRRLALAGLAGVLLGQRPRPTEAQCRAKEGKEKRQCRRRHRDGNAPGAGGGVTCTGVCLFGSSCGTGCTCVEFFPGLGTCELR